eukprot:CAMPEP_0202873604 /NCGR_PEP_ID=MMETSP1391-20130828/23588_1 /ASSEMBLY_ACC=CAM_ASM_000867 /TAXON_ID=1034604 /ORGANISM="Chlamydomonas leiostraca, Strain SAG 11-49" /LENGTH=122 /DNA_ID=CAMNT_0049554855 /DNA_START=457 /DNA_END=825 /DNA_ORIENTATION=+
MQPLLITAAQPASLQNPASTPRLLQPAPWLSFTDSLCADYRAQAPSSDHPQRHGALVDLCAVLAAHRACCLVRVRKVDEGGWQLPDNSIKVLSPQYCHVRVHCVELSQPGVLDECLVHAVAA